MAPKCTDNLFIVFIKVAPKCINYFNFIAVFNVSLSHIHNIPTSIYPQRFLEYRVVSGDQMYTLFIFPSLCCAFSGSGLNASFMSRAKAEIIQQQMGEYNLQLFWCHIKIHSHFLD